jgi:hypothetical protein
MLIPRRGGLDIKGRDFFNSIGKIRDDDPDRQSRRADTDNLSDELSAFHGIQEESARSVNCMATRLLLDGPRLLFDSQRLERHFLNSVDRPINVAGANQLLHCAGIGELCRHHHAQQITGFMLGNSSAPDYERQTQRNKPYYFYAPPKPDLVLRRVLLYPRLAKCVRLAVGCSVFLAYCSGLTDTGSLYFNIMIDVEIKINLIWLSIQMENASSLFPKIFFE